MTEGVIDQGTNCTKLSSRSTDIAATYMEWYKRHTLYFKLKHNIKSIYLSIWRNNSRRRALLSLLTRVVQTSQREVTVPIQEWDRHPLDVVAILHEGHITRFVCDRFVEKDGTRGWYQSLGAQDDFASTEGHNNACLTHQMGTSIGGTMAPSRSS
ncbi:uncharacterized protein BJ212DRAFT_1584050 [Suillus subaureus]|uniref:Uncharacterized protein n=1 Tax=Suillus subaureus TaxID=48587 RepID=A0A9P7EME4_9AGAM|nr:uncharacterized protein BJ212DRAFT_1584050 [Suillus subaureus]KAG1825495.1 hypothetical protein BJ212DRAFT_1584050 [Suillus subaureus]